MLIAAATTSYPLLNIFRTMFEFSRDQGTFTAQEFEREKAKILA